MLENLILHTPGTIINANTLKPFVPIFILKYDTQEKETITIVTDMDGNLRLLGDCFCSTSAGPLGTGKSHLHRLLVNGS